MNYLQGLLLSVFKRSLKNSKCWGRVPRKEQIWKGVPSLRLGFRPHWRDVATAQWMVSWLGYPHARAGPQHQAETAGWGDLKQETLPLGCWRVVRQGTTDRAWQTESRLLPGVFLPVSGEKNKISEEPREPSSCSAIPMPSTGKGEMFASPSSSSKQKFTDLQLKGRQWIGN